MEARSLGQIRDLFNQWLAGEGLTELVIPMLEPLSTFERVGLASELSLFKVIDGTGQVLVTKGDATIPVARLAASGRLGSERPLQLGYFTNLVRREADQGGLAREFFQAGVEFIGVQGASADARVLNAAAGFLMQAGLADFRLGLGHVRLLPSLLQRAAVPLQPFQEALEAGDFVSLESLLGELPSSVRSQLKCLLLPYQVGSLSLDEQLLALRQLAAQAEDEAASVCGQIVDMAGQLQPAVKQRLLIDLTLQRGLPYYTGLVFEVYGSGGGKPVAGGGRYDKLLTSFGEDSPAVGFAIDVDELQQVLAGAGWHADGRLMSPPKPVLYPSIH